MARPAATVYFVLMLTSVRATELTADWPTMEVGALKEATAASRPSMAISERRDSVEFWRRHRGVPYPPILKYTYCHWCILFTKQAYLKR